MIKALIAIFIIAFFASGCVEMGRYEKAGTTCKTRKVIYQNSPKIDTIYLKAKQNPCVQNSSKLHAFSSNNSHL